MQIHGAMMIGRRAVRGSAGVVHAIAPARHATLEPAFGLATREDLHAACELAEEAFGS
jgi:alpha-ketoglutaric semialdehyde dehydrogenase